MAAPKRPATPAKRRSSGSGASPETGQNRNRKPRAPRKPATKKPAAKPDLTLVPPPIDDNKRDARSADARAERKSNTAERLEAGAAAGQKRLDEIAKRDVDDPPELPDTWKVLWRDSRTRMERDNTWHKTLRPLLDAMVRHLHDAEVLQAAASSEPFVEGSMGQLVDHPGFARADKAQDKALAIATKLLLTPESRAKHKLDEDRDADDDLSKILNAASDVDDDDADDE